MAPPQAATPDSFSTSGGTYITDPINFPIAHGPQSPNHPAIEQSGPRKQPLTFRSSRIVYYGPHACDNCGSYICRMGREWGGNSFDYPSGPIYPNTEWNAHICDPKDVQNFNDAKGIPRSSV